jgi:hypothetical protein
LFNRRKIVVAVLVSINLFRKTSAATTLPSNKEINYLKFGAVPVSKNKSRKTGAATIYL